MSNQWVAVLLAFILAIMLTVIINGAEKVQREQRKKMKQDERKKIAERFKWM